MTAKAKIHFKGTDITVGGLGMSAADVLATYENAAARGQKTLRLGPKLAVNLDNVLFVLVEEEA